MADTTAFWISPQQQHAWSLQQLFSPENGIAAIFLEGPLDSNKLRTALTRVIARHEIFRTVFRRSSGMKVPFQIVLEGGEPTWETGGSDLASLIKTERTSPLPLEDGPVTRACLHQTGKELFYLTISVPALCCDKCTLRTLVKEVGLFYADRGDELTPEPLQYKQFAQWQNDILAGDDDDAREGKKYWESALGDGIDFLTLPEQKDALGVYCSESVAVTLLRQVDSADSSEADTLLAAWWSLLWRLTGRTTFITSVDLEGRHFEELRGAFGPIAKSAPFRVSFEGDLRFKEVIHAVHHLMEQAQDRFEYLAGHNDMSTSFGYEEHGEGEVYGGVKFTLVEAEAGVEPYTLKLMVKRQVGKLKLEFRYDAAKLTRSTVERWSQQFQTLLEAALVQPDAPVSRLPLLTEQELHRQLVEWNQTAAEYPRERCFHELFEAQAERTPDRVAVRSEGRQLSYRELNEAANQLAHHLRQCGVGPDQRVGLCLERSVDLLVGMLGIVKAGGAYVPLHTEQPALRWQQQLAGAVALVTEQKLAGGIPAFGGVVICLDGEAGEWRKQPASNPALQAKPENLIYVIYTSGSTGMPKGVLVRHRNLVNYAWAMVQRLDWDQVWDQAKEGLQFATVSTLSADLGNTCIFPALLTGGCVHLIKPEMATDPRALGRYFVEQKIDVLKIVPSHLRALLEAGGGREILPRHSLVLGGEMLTPALLERVEALNAGCAVINHYGPTETTVGSLLLPLKEYAGRAAGSRSIPIGGPIANTRIYVLDAYRQPVAVGVEGELYIAGAGVTAGYLEQVEQTAERFVADLFDNGERMYRTGDRVRYLADGQVEYLGRVDEQVKIRGYRVEPGEVEAVLAEHAGVRQAIVIAREQENGQKQLLGYVVMRAQASTTMAELQRYLQGRLPDYLVPAALLAIGKVPLTANGKLDRDALPSPEQAAAGAETYAPPETDIERSLTAIWEQVLRRQHIGRHDNFFHIGGHSLLATQIVSRVREKFHVDLAVRSLFEQPTIASFSGAVEAAFDEEMEDDSEIVPVPREAYRVPSSTSRT